jgi:hypothetical protein
LPTSSDFADRHDARRLRSGSFAKEFDMRALARKSEELQRETAVPSPRHRRARAGSHASAPAARFLQRSPAPAAAPRADQESAPYSFHRLLVGMPRSTSMQAKLSLGTPGDVYEQEADRIAEQVSSSAGTKIRRTCSCGGTCASCQDRQQLDERSTVQTKRAATESASESGVPATVHGVLATAGRPLDRATRADLEPRLGVDLSEVRVHTDAAAAESAAEIGALAYTVGKDIVFGADQYAPSSSPGRHLLAHELVHTMQQDSGRVGRVVQRFGGCTSAQDRSVAADHTRALAMVGRAIGQLALYDGTSPAKVHTALATHFGGATSTAFGVWIAGNLVYLGAAAAVPAYECYTGGILESSWACGGRALATTFWCVPGVDIRLCPSYFGQTATERATTLIHEWVHKYGCNLDLGYEHESDYSGNSTFTQLMNADSFANFVRDVQ